MSDFTLIAMSQALNSIYSTFGMQLQHVFSVLDFLYKCIVLCCCMHFNAKHIEFTQCTEMCYAVYIKLPCLEEFKQHLGLKRDQKYKSFNSLHPDTCFP